jgi:hypothetical protein
MSWQQYAPPGSFIPAPGFGASGWQQYAPPGSFTPAPSTSAGSSSGGGFSTGQLGGLLNIANLGLSMVGMNNANQSYNQFQQAAGVLGDAATGRQYHALNTDIFNQKEAPLWASKFTANDPFYSQANRANRFYDLAGKYGGTAFGGFAGS